MTDQKDIVAPKKPRALTIKQVKFAKAWFETGNKSEAYRFAYDCENMSDEVIRNEACILSAHRDISVMVENMQAEFLAASQVTAHTIVSKAMEIANYGLTEEVKPQSRTDEEEGVPVQLRQVNPASAVSALNLVSDIIGVKAAVRAKLEIESPVETPDTIAMVYARQNFGRGEAERLHHLTNVEKMGIAQAVELIRGELSGNILESE